MRHFTLVLRLAGALIFLVGALHLTLGAGADVLLGARLSAATLADPALDSQNRFYGVAFTLYAVLLFLCASDLARYGTVLRCMLWVFFAGGCARLVSIAVHGMPPPQIVGLLATELLGPVVLAVWLRRVGR